MLTIMVNYRNHFLAILMPSSVMLSMGFAAVLSNGLNPEIMLAIDFRCPFCATFWTSKK